MTPYYDRAGITIYCGETLEVMAYLYETLRLIFDAIICDLPYGTTACSWDTIIPFEPLWENYKRLVKANGAVVLFGSQPFTSKLVMSNLEWFKYDLTWKKPRGTGHLNASKQPLRNKEEIIIFSGGQTTYNPQFKSGIPYTAMKGGRQSRVSNTGETTYGKFYNGAKYRNDNEGKRYPTQILEFGVVERNTLHPTQKPVALLAYLIRTYTNPGDLILDNCMGSGTTLLAAQNEGRQATGIEISEEYCKITVDRLRQPSFFSIPDKPKPEIAKQKELL